MSNTYSLRGGEAAIERLKLLAEVKWPSTQALLRRVGLRPGMRVLDLGCGIGEVTKKLGEIVGPDGAAVGTDRDEAAIRIAQQRVPGAEFFSAGASDLEGQALYHLVYARYLLCHVSDPSAVLRAARTALKPGGMIVVEDIDFDGHICHPPSPAFDEYLMLFKAVVHLNGGDACIGPRLPELLRDAGFEDVHVDVVTPLFDRGEGRTVAAVTLRHIRESLLSRELATIDELDRLEQELTRHCDAPGTLVSLARTFQAWGGNP